MGSSRSNLVGLSDPDRQMLEAWLTEFDQSWEEGRLPKLIRLLPPNGTTTRYPALLELIKIDLRRRWQNGIPVPVESYLRNYPELGSTDTAPVSLILAEYNARREFGTTPLPAEMYRRFPHQAEDLRHVLEPHTVPPPPAQPPSSWGGSTGGVNQPNAPTLTGPTGPGGPSFLGTLPEQFGRYRIIKKLGQGGMGAVYLARDTQLDRQVALKVPHFSQEDGPEVLARFQREARAAATVQHPSICPVYDVGEINGTHYLAMGFIEGRALKELVSESRPMALRDAADIIRQLALALEEAHAQGVIHRDLKPTNVIINARGVPVILDFGLARRMNAESVRLTRTGAVLGTPAYMSPEQVTGDGNTVGPHSDIYSLGVILYELLTGRTPFEGPMAAIVGQLITDDPEPPKTHRRDLDSTLDLICRKAMAKKPEDRFPSMATFAETLSDYLRGKPVNIAPPPSGKHPRLITPAPPTAQKPASPPTPNANPVSKPVRTARTDWRNSVHDLDANAGTGMGRNLMIVLALVLLASLAFLAVRLGTGLLDSSKPTTPGKKAEAAPDPNDPPAHETPPPGLLDRARAALAGKDYPAAIPLFSEALKAEPNNVKALHERGTALYFLGDLDGALADFTAALKLAPIDAKLSNDRAVVHADKGDDLQALADYDAALAKDAANAEARSNRGVLLAIRHELDRALEDCNAALQMDGKCARAYSNRARVHVLRNDLDKARADAEEGVRLATESAHALRHRAIVHAANKDYDKALADHAGALKLDPKLVFNYHARAGLYRALEQYDKALADYDAALKLSPNDVLGLLGRSETYRRMNKHDEAVADCTEAITLSPNFARAYLVRGNLHYDKGDYDKAIENYGAATQHAPANAAAYYALGNAYQARNNPEKAIANFTAAIQHDPLLFSARLGRGRIYLDEKKYTEALADFDAAVQIDPTNADALNSRGLCHLNNKEPGKAVEDFTLAIRLDGDNASYYSNRAKAHQANGDGTLARSDDERAAQLRKLNEQAKSK